jgi:protein-S-isoprenylcysteine O-methyltransferase Ste14
MTRVLPPVYFLGALATAIAAHVLAPLGLLPIPWAWRFAGLLPIAAGVVLNLAADRELERLGTTVKPLQRSAALATGGVFRWSRNPMYLGMILIIAGTALVAGSISPWIAVAGLAIVLDRVFVVREEEMLEDAFGDAFERYSRRVRRWL